MGRYTSADEFCKSSCETPTVAVRARGATGAKTMCVPLARGFIEIGKNLVLRIHLMSLASHTNHFTIARIAVREWMQKGSNDERKLLGGKLQMV